jgi:hypothetical protein
MFRTLRWRRPTIASFIALPVLALSAASAASPPAGSKTITAVMHSDLRIIDPGFTTAYITRITATWSSTRCWRPIQLQDPAADGRLESLRRQAHLYIRSATD